MSKFIISWCCEGLEGIVPIDQYEKWDEQKVFRILQGTVQDNERNPMNGILQSMVLRARYNMQRRYEIYAIEATDGINENDIREMFENAPHHAADTIRRIGVKIYSDRQTESLKQRIVIE